MWCLRYPTDGKGADNVSCRFLPNSGKYMLNVLNGKSNGEEKDRAFGWKLQADLDGARQKSVACEEWCDLQDDQKSVSAKL